MSDHELLELAAKAAGVGGKVRAIQKPYSHDYEIGVGKYRWNPLTNDGDALRLAVKMNLFVDTYDAEVLAGWVVDKDALSMNTLTQAKGGDPYAATRRAIVRAAALIGKEMK